MNYPLSHYVTLNYLLMFDPSMPSISQQSSMIQTIDDISVRQGNPDLKPSEYLRNRIYIRYSIKNLLVLYGRLIAEPLIQFIMYIIT